MPTFSTSFSRNPPNIIMTPTDTQLFGTQQTTGEIGLLKQQMSSGGAPGSYSQVSDPSTLVGTSAALTSLDSSQNDCNSLLAFQQFTITQLLAVKEINVSFNRLLQQATTSNATGFPEFQNNVQLYLTQLTSILNTPFHGANPFSGTATNVNPVLNLLTQPSLPAGSGIDTTYYQGNTSTTSLNLDASSTVTLFQVNATSPAIEKLVRALRIAKIADSMNPQDTAMLSALDLTTQVNTTDMGNAIIQANFPIDIINTTLESIDPLRQSYTEIIQSQVLDDFHATLMALQNAEANLHISEFLIMQEARDLADFLKSI